MTDADKKQIETMVDQKIGVVLEHMDHKFELIMEILIPMRQDLDEIKKVELPEIKHDIKTMKAALTATNHQVHDHEQRISKLEASAA